MGIYNRDYYRESTNSSRYLGGASVVKYIIIANAVVFVLQLISVRDVLVAARDEFGGRMFVVDRISVVQEWLQLDTEKTVYQGQLWRLITCAFCHDRDNLLHIIINMFVLYMFGRTLESIYGPREFLLFYLAAAIVASVAFVGLQFCLGERGYAIGASGAVMAVMMLYTMHFPRQIIYLFMIIPVEMRWATLLYLAWDLYPILLNLSGRKVSTGIAHAAHVGGLAFGFLYAHYQWRFERIVVSMPGLPRRQPRRPRLRLALAPPPEPAANSDDESRRLDQVLEKISRSGQDSLNDEERAILRNASERLKGRRRGEG
jgi:membrane associated rhomboid family serine protease